MGIEANTGLSTGQALHLGKQVGPRIGSMSEYRNVSYIEVCLLVAWYLAIINVLRDRQISAMSV